MSFGMYGLRTIVTVFQGVWCWLLNLVVVNGLTLMWDLLFVDYSIFCNTFFVLCSARGLDCDAGQCDVTSVWLHWLSVFACVSACFAFGFHWFKCCVCVFRVEGDRCIFEGTQLATFPIVAMGFSALIHKSAALSSSWGHRVWYRYLKGIFRVSLNHKILCIFFIIE
jgi:hypothetical protein